MTGHCERLQAQIRELEASLAKTSQTSHQPPAKPSLAEENFRRAFALLVVREGTRNHLEDERLTQ
ncbi:hypothetical protein SAMN00790413_05041 [Deinococcus hopiensis KR-140]|uniref:Uncharacterized protein n=1 Tax=Deinococcus hopiensis KR-140 TaxID=695939 RepID=A0A1W1USY3_9DEIO|nr:hypothetical protein SAMN00790413_05041 [Deinococcus hopiensis KR-140]